MPEHHPQAAQAPAVGGYSGDRLLCADEKGGDRQDRRGQQGIRRGGEVDGGAVRDGRSG